MTESQVLDKKKTGIGHLTSIACLLCALVMILFGEELKDAIYDGFLFSFTTIIPTLFPFFILSDLWSAYFNISADSKIGKAFNKAFGINGSATPVWLAGLICGFPLGVKSAAELKNDGRICAEEFERLSGFSNNPSLAFVIFGVGGGILGSVWLGVLLYLSVIFSSIMTGLIFRRTAVASNNSKENSRQSFNLVKSIRSAGLNSISVASYIIFFSGVMGLMSQVLSEPIITLISPFLEVSNSVKLLSSSKYLPRNPRLSLIAMALGFSGFSVHLQAFSFFPSDAKKHKYLIMKLTQGLISSAAFSLIIYLLH